jgi:hypothetical protein
MTLNELLTLLDLGLVSDELLELYIYDLIRQIGEA